MSDIITRFTAAGVEEYEADVQKLADANRELAGTEKQVEAASKSLRTQLREMTQELARMSQAGKTNTEEYKKLRDAAGQLKDAMTDASREIATAGSDTRGLDKALRATNVLLGGFTAVQGAAALFGDESENLQKTLLKVNAAMSILNGLQAIQNELTQKDSIITAAAAKAKDLYTKFTTTATVATKALTVAISGGLLLVLGLLITNWDKVTAALDRNKKKILELRKAQDDLKTSQDRQLQRLQAEENILRLQGESEEDILSRRKELSEQFIQDNEDLIAQLEAQKAQITAGQRAVAGQGFRQSAASAAKQTAELNKRIDELNISNELLQGEIAGSILAIQNQGKATEKTAAQTERLATAQKELEDSTDGGGRVPRRQQTEIAIEQQTAGELGDIRANANQADIEAHADRLRAKLDAEEEYNREIRFQDRETFRQRSAMAQQAFDVAARFEQSLFQIVDNSFALQQQELENKRAAGLITEKQYAKEIAKLQQKQLKASKATGIVEATINGAVAALKAFAELGPIGGAIAAALIAGITATQIALIAKQKIPNIPGFFRGTKDAPPGMKWVGEKGPELINDQGGYAIIPAGESQRISDMYKKWNVPTITVPDLTFRHKAYQPIGGDKIRSTDKNYTDLLRKVDELILESRFNNQYTKQGNSIAQHSQSHLKDLKTSKRGIYT